MRRSGSSMNRKVRDRRAEMRLTERTRKLIPETRRGVPKGASSRVMELASDRQFTGTNTLSLSSLTVDQERMTLVNDHPCLGPCSRASSVLQLCWLGDRTGILPAKNLSHLSQRFSAGPRGRKPRENWLTQVPGKRPIKM